jgi:hypothetical protein
MYIHELQDWPWFYWNQGELAELLASVRHRQGRLVEPPAFDQRVWTLLKGS